MFVHIGWLLGTVWHLGLLNAFINTFEDNLRDQQQKVMFDSGTAFSNYVVVWLVLYLLLWFFTRLKHCLYTSIDLTVTVYHVIIHR